MRYTTSFPAVVCGFFVPISLLGRKSDCSKYIWNNITGIYMPAVKIKENEPFDVALRRFKRSCEKAGVMTEVRRREAYEKPTTERKRKAAAAVKRHLKKLSKDRGRFARSPHQNRR